MKLSLAPAALALSSLFLSTTVTTAWPTGAGSCQGGQAATTDAAAHMKPTTMTGVLSKGAFVVTIDGQTLLKDTPMKIPVGQEVSVELSSPDSDFKGFLLRLSSTNATKSTVDTLLMENEMDTEVQVSDLCVEAGVGGLTHTSNDLKTSVMGTILIPQEDAGLMLDVTVVRSNSGDVSEYFYDGFSLMATNDMGMESMGMDMALKEQLDRIESKLDTLLSQSCGTAAATDEVAAMKSGP